MTIVVSFQTPAIYKLIVCNIVCQLLSYKVNYMHYIYIFKHLLVISSLNAVVFRHIQTLAKVSIVIYVTRPVSCDNSPLMASIRGTSENKHSTYKIEFHTTFLIIMLADHVIH